MTNQEAIEQLKLNNPFMGGKDKELFSQAIDKGIEALENQKTGHWIRWYEEIQRGTHYTENIPHCKCSECNREYDTHTSKFIKYCPQCGAKMEGDK